MGGGGREIMMEDTLFCACESMNELSKPVGPYKTNPEKLERVDTEDRVAVALESSCNLFYCQ